MPQFYPEGLKMEKARRAAMFSALLFPGWGQIYLGHIVRGLVFIISSLAGAALLAWQIIQASLKIIKESPFIKGTVRFEDILIVTLNALKSVNLAPFLLLLSLIFILWVVSIFDALQLGKKQELSRATGADQSIISDPQ